MPRQTATERNGARRSVLRQAGLAIVVLGLGVLATLAARRSAAQGGSDLDRFNGFESGGAGEYLTVGTPSGSSSHRLDAAGAFGLQTAASPGVNEYAQVSLSAPAAMLTDGIWACVETAPTGGARRIRSWLNGADVVVELRLNSNRQLQIVVNDEPVILSSPPLSQCPNFSSIVMQYSNSGTIVLSVDGNETSASHASTALLDTTRIGPDDGAARNVAVVWDDHGAVRDLTFPGALRIAGLVARPPSNPNDPNFRSEWPPSVGCSSAVTCTDEQPPDSDATFVSAAALGAMQSFCTRLAAPAGIFGNILAVKSLLYARTTAAPASLGLQLRTNAQACGGPAMGAGTSDPDTVTLGTAYAGVMRVDTTMPGGSSWTLTGLDRAALQVSLASGANARVTQVVREVAFDSFGFPSPTPTVTSTPTPTVTSTPTATFTITGTFTASATDTPSATQTPAPTDTRTPSATPTPTFTRTITLTPSITSTATITSLASPTGTPSSTRTASSTPSVTSTASATSSRTATGTATPTVPSRQIARASGFEAGWKGDYTVFPDGTGLKMVSGAANVRSGEYAAELPSEGFARYLETSLPRASQTFSDGIWACFSSTVMGDPQRIRQWSGTVSDVVGLWLLPNARLELRVLGVPVGISNTPLSVCPTYTHLEVQYRNLSAGGAALLRVDGQVEVSAGHISLATVRDTRIGHDSGNSMATLHWDDHTFSPGVVFPGDLSIVGFVPAADGFYGSSWSRQNCPAGPLFPCLGNRPPNISTVISHNEANERASFCLDSALPGVAEPIVGVKMLASMREIPSLASLGGLFLRSGGCANPAGTDRPEVTFDPNTAFVAFSRLDETNPATGDAWSLSDIGNTEFGVRHPDDEQDLYVTQLVVEVIYDRNPPPPLPTSTRTQTQTPTRTATPTVSTTPTSTGTPTQTPLPSDTPTMTPTGGTSTATRTRTPPSTPSASATATSNPLQTATITRTPSNTATPTETPDDAPSSPTVTRTGTVTPTETPTGPTATATRTFPLRDDYIFGMGDTNSWLCSSDRATDLNLSSTSRSLLDLSMRENPDTLRGLFLSIYIAPGLDEIGYGFLQVLSEPPSVMRPLGGFIHRFVEIGGLAVINVAPSASLPTSVQLRPGLAPRGVGYQPPLTSSSESINRPTHPFITGQGFGGEPLSSARFASWNPTDRGYLTNVPADATIILRNSSGPTMIEYPHGNGKVIVTTLTFCTPDQPLSMGTPLDNLLKYGRFFLGGAQTPPPTVTPTLTPTATLTGLATATATRTRSGAVTPTATETAPLGDTATPTPGICAGDCDDRGIVDVSDLLRMVNIFLGSLDISNCPAGDVAGGDPDGPDGEISIDELVRAVNNALEGCP